MQKKKRKKRKLEDIVVTTLQTTQHSAFPEASAIVIFYPWKKTKKTSPCRNAPFRCNFKYNIAVRDVKQTQKIREFSKPLIFNGAINLFLFRLPNESHEKILQIFISFELRTDCFP